MEDSARRGAWQRLSGAFLAVPASIWLLIFFSLPLLILTVMSFLTRGSTPSDYNLPITLGNYEIALNDTYRPVLLRSISIAFQTTLICFVLGYPLAFFISTRRNAWMRQLALFMVILPFWTNFLVRTYAWRAIIGRRGVLNELLVNQLQLFDSIPELLNTRSAVLIGLVYGFLPFMVLPIYASIERFDFRLVEAGHDLGANDWRVFWRVVFPLTLPGVVAGWILVFIPTIGAFVTPDMLGGTRGLMIGNLIQRQFRGSGGNWTVGSAMSILIMLIVMAALYIYFRYANEDSYTGGESNWWTRIKQQLTRVVPQPQEAVPAANKGEGMEQDRSLKVVEFDRVKIWRDRTMRQVGKIALYLVPIISYVFLWTPIVLLIAYSFNDSRRSASTWEGFTTQWYTNIFEGVVGSEAQFSTEEMLESLQVSMQVTLAATVLSTAFGTLIAMALVRYQFRGRNVLNSLLYLPIVIPDIAQGVSLLAFFGFIFDVIDSATGRRFSPGIGTVIAGHVAFNISFVAIVVRARLTDMNPRLEEAARDLGANEWRTFWRVTYPLLLPGIVAGGLLAFTISLDDFVVTFFAGAGNASTLTIFVYGLVKRSVTPEINAISTLMILSSTILIFFSFLLQTENANRYLSIIASFLKIFVPVALLLALFSYVGSGEMMGIFRLMGWAALLSAILMPLWIVGNKWRASMNAQNAI